MSSFLVVLAFLFSSMFLTPAVSGNVSHSSVLSFAHKTTYHTAQSTIIETAYCSATAIGPHALLTATHCEVGSDEIDLEGIAKPFHIVGHLRDGNDHTIYFLSGAAFPKFSTLDEAKKLEEGDKVFLFGNPGTWSDLYREGTFSGVVKDSSFFSAMPDELAFNLTAYHGDSGSALFDSDGNIVGVVTATISQGKDNDSISMAESFPLVFSKEQIEQARTFGEKSLSAKGK